MLHLKKAHSSLFLYPLISALFAWYNSLKMLSNLNSKVKSFKAVALFSDCVPNIRLRLVEHFHFFLFLFRKEIKVKATLTLWLPVPILNWFVQITPTNRTSLSFCRALLTLPSLFPVSVKRNVPSISTSNPVANVTKAFS